MLKYYSYRIPFRTPFKISGAIYEFREGIILEFEREGIKEFGEVAPLPGFSLNTLDQVLSVLRLNKKPLENGIIKGEFPQFLFVLSQIHDIPSLKFGLDTLYHDYQSKRNGVSLAEFLFSNQTNKTVTSNAVLGISDLDTAVSNANKLIKDGFNTIKVKVGTDFKKEYKILTALRTNYPSLRIRIDANQSWSFNEAVSNLKKAETLNIEYCEEPLISEDIHQISLLKKKVKIKLAADESIGNKKAVTPLSVQNEFDVFVLKPTMIGSFSEIYVTKQLADSHYTDIVFTTSLETKIGRTVTAILATGGGANNNAQG